MRVVVMGAGVVGVATAWYLARAGHEVTVVDRQPGPGLETSFANGGQISPCHAEPWANPTTLARTFHWLGREDAPLIFRWRRWDPALWAWLARFLANCPGPRVRRNIHRILRVAVYSRSCLQALRDEIPLDYDQKTLGILHIYRDAEEFAHARSASRIMRGLGLEREVKTREQALAIEPALAAAASDIAGAIFTPSDESGDAYKFTCRLAEHCASRGVQFRYGSRILGLEPEAGRIAAIATQGGRVRGDAFVMALGSWSPLLARHLGLRLPIYPAKGYSATVTVEDDSRAPSVSITDDEYKMVYSRLGNRLRCAGTAELAGWNPAITPARAEALVKRAQALFPGAGDYGRAELWAGLRPVTPDSVPIIGRTAYDNLFLNSGHGTLGWTMSCGSGRLMADLVSGRPPDIDTEGLGPERFRLF